MCKNQHSIGATENARNENATPMWTAWKYETWKCG